MSNITALTYVGNFGQMVKAFDVVLDEAISEMPSPECFALKNAYKHFPGGSVISSGVTKVEPIENGVRLYVDEFLYSPDFAVEGLISFTKGDITAVKTEYADDFEALEGNGFHYRLYSPKCKGKRPLVVFLHGGGERGNDNWKHMVATIGAAKIAERYPTAYVLAPQSPAKETAPATANSVGGHMSAMKRLEMGNDRPFHYPDDFTHNDFGHGLLANMEAIIRNMIAEGKVDEKRVYVTGLSMGGAGTLRAIAVSKDLYAACAPICPFINDEIYYNLSHSTIPTWVSLPYLDHVFERNMYVAHAVIAAKKAGNKNMHLTIYSREEMEKYGIGNDPGTPLTARITQNHAAWILTYNNEYGILDWLMNQVKE